jgi:hypothetical protein
MATPWSSSKTTRKLNLQPISNIELFPAHVELELGMLGVAGKLVKDVIHLWSQKFWNFFSFLFFLQATPNSKQPPLGFNFFLRLKASCPFK